MLARERFARSLRWCRCFLRAAVRQSRQEARAQTSSRSLLAFVVSPVRSRAGRRTAPRRSFLISTAGPGPTAPTNTLGGSRASGTHPWAATATGSWWASTAGAPNRSTGPASSPPTDARAAPCRKGRREVAPCSAATHRRAARDRRAGLCRASARGAKVAARRLNPFTVRRAQFSSRPSARRSSVTAVALAGSLAATCTASRAAGHEAPPRQEQPRAAAPAGPLRSPSSGAARTDWATVRGGLLLFGVSYVASAAAALSEGAESSDRWLFAPVAGPWIALAAGPSSAWGLVLAGIAQGSGAALVTWGACCPRRVLGPAAASGQGRAIGLSPRDDRSIGCLGDFRQAGLRPALRVHFLF